MGDESLIASILEELENTRNRLAQTEKELHENKELLGKLSSEKPDLPEMRRSRTESGHVSVNSFSASDLKCSIRVEDDIETVEFPQLNIEAFELPSLARDLSSNSLMFHHISQISSLIEDHESIQSKLDSKISEINEQARTEISRLKEAAEGSLNQRQEAINERVQQIKEDLEGSLLIEKRSERTFIINNIEENKLKLSQLIDNNGICLLEPRNISKPLKYLADVQILHKSELGPVIESMQDKEIQVQFQMISVEDQNIFCPTSIRPEGIPVQNYEMKFSQETLKGVINKTDGPVKFTCTQISEDCGLMQDSVVEIFTAAYRENILNILHMHINDTKEEVAFEAVYILENQSHEEYAEWSQDARGIDLRYKIIVKNNKIEAVLYNTGQGTENIGFIERRVKENDLVKVEGKIAKITLLPTGMLARNWEAADLELPELINLRSAKSYCNKRHILELPGLVDLKVVVQQGEYISDGEEIAVPICQCFELSDTERTEVQLIIDSFNIQKKQVFEKNILELGEMLQEFNKGNCDEKELLRNLVQKSEEVKEFLQNNKRYIKTYTRIIQNTDKAIRILTTRSRFS